MSAKDHPNNAPGVPMIFPPWFERFQVKYFNPAVKPFARYLPTFSVIKHRGRTSGKQYETIVTAYRKGNVLAIGLAHGKTDWVKTCWLRAKPTCTSSARTCTSPTRGSCPPAATARGCRGWPGCRPAGSGSWSPISPSRQLTAQRDCAQGREFREITALSAISATRAF